MAPNIYFAGSITGGREDVHIYHRTIQQLKQYGNVLTEFVGDEKFGTSPAPCPDTKAIHDKDVAMLSQCQFVVAELTQISMGVGYELGRAVAMGIQILGLYRRREGKWLSPMVHGGQNGTSFVIVDYTDESEIPNILQNYFSQRLAPAS